MSHSRAARRAADGAVFSRRTRRRRPRMPISRPAGGAAGGAGLGGGTGGGFPGMRMGIAATGRISSCVKLYRTVICKLSKSTD